MSNLRMPLFGTVGLYHPLAIPAITDQFYKRSICLHATEQTLKAFFWKTVLDRGPKHLEPPQPAREVYKLSG
jgi:hypothetical protein